MPLSSSSSRHASKPNALLDRENSLPTYEEATSSEPRGYGCTIPSAPALSTTTHRDVDDSGTTNHYSSNRSPIPQGTLRNQDVERGITQSNLQYHSDPVVHEMAETVMAECERAKKKREMNILMNAFAFFIALIVVIVVIAIKSASHR